MLSPTNPRLTRIAGALRLTSVAFAAALFALPALAFETRGSAAYVLDVGTGTVLLSKDADQPRPPASMSKLMTLYVAFEALRDGRLTLDERLPVSEHAMSYKGSTMFLDTTDRVRVEDLLRGIIVLSGNDACVVLAEALSPDGTEAGFARYMTERARQMGMMHSTFSNANGWPAAGHLMSVHDLAILATHIITDFPEYYPLFSETEFAFDGRAPSNTRNRNPLLGLGIGADGLKTGHTEEAGYGLVGSASQGGRRVVFVVSGLSSKEARADEAEAVVNWSFRQFAEKTVLNAETPIAQAEVFMGRDATVGLVAPEDVKTLLPAISGSEVPAEVVYSAPIKAPVTRGQQLAELVFAPGDLAEVRFPLVAERDVPVGGFLVRVQTAASALITRFINGPKEVM
ncbi:D-alanyl-D-alanine carboxypeptidase family protein [Aquicoccus sp. SU-CL01552]|uniref:D-alanyl-D-alanine carboxypeptidase family protein n=1 Tax=Aquicoccus sp. SU-CL01552 TaxID=3127656 RepID=UPI0031039809